MVVFSRRFDGLYRVDVVCLLHVLGELLVFIKDAQEQQELAIRA